MTTVKLLTGQLVKRGLLDIEVAEQLIALEKSNLELAFITGVSQGKTRSIDDVDFEEFYKEL